MDIRIRILKVYQRIYSDIQIFEYLIIQIFIQMKPFPVFEAVGLVNSVVILSQFLFGI